MRFPTLNISTLNGANDQDPRRGADDHSGARSASRRCEWPGFDDQLSDLYNADPKAPTAAQASVFVKGAAFYPTLIFHVNGTGVR